MPHKLISFDVQSDDLGTLTTSNTWDFLPLLHSRPAAPPLYKTEGDLSGTFPHMRPRKGERRSQALLCPPTEWEKRGPRHRTAPR